MLIPFKRVYPDAEMPLRATDGAVGYDVAAYHEVSRTEFDPVTKLRKRVSALPVTLPPHESRLFGIGGAFAVPYGHDCQVRPRSGMATKYEVQLMNAPGTVDPDYRGEIGILLRNYKDTPLVIERGMRIAQLVFMKVDLPQFVEVDQLPPTTRATGGFGSTGFFAVGEGTKESDERQLLLDRYYMVMAVGAAGLSNCLRGAKRENGVYVRNALGQYEGATRRFGCIIEKNGNIIGQGYNQRTSECSEERGCERENKNIPSGKELECGCDHAEDMALANHQRTGGPALEGATVYVNAAPCLRCAKQFAKRGIAAVVIPPNVYENNGVKVLLEAGIIVREVPLPAVTWYSL